MGLSDLILARRAIASGVGSTTRRNRVLPGAADLPDIPARTGIGKPVIQSIKKLARGFMAWVVGATRACLFAHDTLAVRDPNYTKFGHTYSVLPFATPFNVSDETLLHDVLSFVDGDVLVNAAGMPVLGVTTGAPMAGALPWLIPHDTPVGDLGEYGDAVTNATVKRVFAVSRDHVHAWQGGVSDAVLGGASFRPDRALLLGARIDEAEHSAWLSQLAFTGSSWNDISSGWAVTQAQVAMLLTTPYLQKTESVFSPELGVGSLAGPVASSFQTSSAYTLPEAECCAIGVGELGASDFTWNSYSQYRYVNFPWRDVKKHAFSGTRNVSVSRSAYSDTGNQSASVQGHTITASRSNVLTIDNNSEGYNYPDTTVPLYAAKSGGTVLTDSAVYSTTPPQVWPQDSTNGNIVPRGGNSGSGAYFHRGGNVGNTATYSERSQQITASIALGSVNFVTISASRHKQSGNKVVPAAVTGRYASALSNPYGWINASSGFGVGGRIMVELYSYDPTSSSVVGMRQPLIEARAGGYVGGHYYAGWDENSADQASQIYTSSVQARDVVDDQTLTWSTTDYLLHDSTNNCYITVEASFSGAQSYGYAGSATLDVMLKINTPAGVTSQMLFSTTLGYTELLPEVDMGSGLYAIPSPMQRVMFTPLYQAQGDFKGAAYTTAAEVEAGAVAAHLFNFVLKLDTYSAVGEDALSLPVVHFIPCNLLEMLYEFVYSTKYGVDEYERYPVDATATFNSLQSTLFANQWRVCYRDGVLVDWLDTLGGTYTSEEQTGIFRI